MSAAGERSNNSFEDSRIRTRAERSEFYENTPRKHVATG